MAKRMLDTEIWSQRWFCDLSTDAKMLYFYFWGNCNHAGILDLWEKRFKDDTGLSLSKCIKEMDGLIFEYKPGSFFMPKFISDQYPDFPNSKVRAQDSAIKILEREGLIDSILNPLERVSKPLDKAYGYGYDNGSDNDLTNKGVDKKSSNLPAIVEKKRKGKYLSEDAFLERMQMEGKEQVKIGNGLVYLRRSDYDEMLEEFGRTLLHEMINQLDLYKAQNDKHCGKELYVKDEVVLRKSWVMKNAREALSVKNSPVIADIRKREAIQKEIEAQYNLYQEQPLQPES
jgi:hypothetical protein